MTSVRQSIPPGATLGVMGGGQLGRMWAHVAQQMGYFTAVLDADPHSPAGTVSHHHLQAGYLDEAALVALAQCSAAITTEFENVPAAALQALAEKRPVAPPAHAVAICQDRVLEKMHFTRCGVPCAPYAVIETAQQLAAVPSDLLPGILKTSRLGYDGKGQARVSTREELEMAWSALQHAPCVLEKMLPLALEVSVIVARGHDGQVVHLPLQQNLHRDGILAVTQVPAPDVSTALQERAVAQATSVAASMNYVGVLCVEFFVLQDGSLVANEMAPRPHNSGHYSMDACDVCQFELQVRTMTGNPLTAPRLHSSAVMLNLLGDLWFDPEGCERPPPWADVLALPGAHLHLYGKTEARIGRKMGHLTVTAPSPNDAKKVALQAAALLGLPAF
ncbi:MAG: 5-(carboxyamino)imidazole ribonucleotide synthase [Rhizobacter sp.]